MSFQKWVIYIVSLFVIIFLFALGDAMFAGIISLCVSLFEANVAGSVFKWIFVVLLYLETLITIPCLYNVVKKRKDF